MMLLTLIFSLISHAQIEGRWITSDQEGLIEIKKVDDTYIGIILDGKDNPKTKGKDIYNPDKNLRQRDLKGIQILSGLKKTNDKLFEEGRIYDPLSGNTYLCQIDVVSSDEIKLKGFVLIPLFGRSEKWKRAPVEFKGWEH